MSIAIQTRATDWSHFGGWNASNRTMYNPKGSNAQLLSPMAIRDACSKIHMEAIQMEATNIYGLIQEHVFKFFLNSIIICKVYPAKGQHVRIIKCKRFGKSDSCFWFSWFEAGPTASDTSLASIAAAWATKPISFGSFIMAPFPFIARKSWLRQLWLPLGGRFGLCCCFAFGVPGWSFFLILRLPNFF